jgi:predicted O-methyltransferase YrrM
MTAGGRRITQSANAPKRAAGPGHCAGPIIAHTRTREGKVELIAEAVTLHLESLAARRPAVLEEMEAVAKERDFPIIGPAAGQLCYVLARLMGARRVFEMGSGFGYSTAWFARAVRENGGGEVHHVVWDEGLTSEARKWLAKLGLDDLVRYHTKEAVSALSEQQGAFDLVFVDIDKDAYPQAIRLAGDKLRAGGLLIVDNALWSGRIFDEADRSPATEGVREATRLLGEAPWISTLAPIRDGVFIAMRV